MKNKVARHKRSLKMQGFGKLLKDYREINGLKQDQLAAALGVKPSTISAWESGYYDPSKKMVEKLTRMAASPYDERFSRFLGLDIGRLREMFGAHTSPEGGAENIEEYIQAIPLFDADNVDGGPRVEEAIPRVWLAPDLETVAVRVRAPLLLYPFMNGDIAYVQRMPPQSLWLLGEIFAVHFERYPEKIVEGRYDGEFEKEGINVGWLVLERPHVPDYRVFTGRPDELPTSSEKEPWRFVLQGADVGGVRGSSYPLPLTEWQSSTAGELNELITMGRMNVQLKATAKILGRVIFWKRANLFPILPYREGEHEFAGEKPLQSARQADGAGKETTEK